MKDMGPLRLYAYTLPNAMDEHEYTDDVALCWAQSRKEAVKKFKPFYGHASKKTVHEVDFNRLGVAILTDY